MENKKHISVAELAKILKISRVAVFKRIKNGQIPAQKIGRSYIIDVEDIGKDKLSEKEKETIRKAVQKTVKEYGETLKLLGKE